MTDQRDVDDEARHDWLDQLDELKADARPDPADYADLAPSRERSVGRWSKPKNDKPKRTR